MTDKTNPKFWDKQGKFKKYRRVCPSCQTEFRSSKVAAKYCSGRCRDKESARINKATNEGLPDPYSSLELKICGVCNESLEKKCFRRDNFTKDGLKSNCRKCSQRKEKEKAKMLREEKFRKKIEDERKVNEEEAHDANERRD